MAPDAFATAVAPLFEGAPALRPPPGRRPPVRDRGRPLRRGAWRRPRDAGAGAGRAAERPPTDRCRSRDRVDPVAGGAGLRRRGGTGRVVDRGRADGAQRCLRGALRIPLRRVRCGPSAGGHHPDPRARPPSRSRRGAPPGARRRRPDRARPMGPPPRPAAAGRAASRVDRAGGLSVHGRRDRAATGSSGRRIGSSRKASSRRRCSHSRSRTRTARPISGRRSRA